MVDPDKKIPDLSQDKSKSFLSFFDHERRHRHTLTTPFGSRQATSSVNSSDDLSIRKPEEEDVSYASNARSTRVRGPHDDDEELNKAVIQKILQEDNPFNLRRRATPRKFEALCDHTELPPRASFNAQHEPRRASGHSAPHTPEHPGSSRQNYFAREREHPRGVDLLRSSARYPFGTQLEVESPTPREPSRARYSDGTVSPLGPRERSPTAERRTVQTIAGLRSSRWDHGPLPERTPIQSRARDQHVQRREETGNNVFRQRIPKRLRDDDWEDERRMPQPKRRSTNKNISHGKPHEPKTDIRLCEFSDPCRMNPSPDGMHWRKVVSHIFGRNKASTKLFPDPVWVHYCRKHYQRARYRADQWPFTQCDLILESLYRMEQWGGVQSFELTLRRREQDRDLAQPPTRYSGPTRYLQSGRRHPTAVTAPVPDWLRRELGKFKSFEEIRQIVDRVREYMLALRREKRAEQEGRLRVAESSRQDSGSTMGPGSSIDTSNNNRYPPHRTFHHGGWQAVAPPRGSNTKKYPTTAQMSLVRFPDVEILPTFHGWVYDHDNLRRAEERTVQHRAAEAETREHDAVAREAADREARTQARAEAATEQLEEERRVHSERHDCRDYRRGKITRQETRNENSPSPALSRDTESKPSGDLRF
ncbi:hypothetical protein N7492_006650 [Penicillium capsulatum]|uniref:Uncharacterized protein n=1 Tax=Penicillium capsulatum TaxID=69766 RepID=A0A9W9HYE7_9EURO|nr:hypothetical protein N7492_006650 [Penicillium capsulatum]KAJ6116485.1 hypothetical protein N7512_006210 [Penicillium capsulatum]